MTNTINTPGYLNELNLQSIDEALPFEGKEVWIWSIENRMTGYGHWRLSLEIEINGDRHTLATTTTDSLMIDYWDGLDGEDHGILDDDYVGKFDAIETVLKGNEERLLELAETDEETE